MKTLLLISVATLCCTVHAQTPLPVNYEKCYGGSLNDGLFKIEASSSSGNIICGVTYSNDGDISGYHGGGDAWLGTTNSSGDLTLSKTFGGSSGDFFFDVKPTADGGFIAAGTSNSSDGDVSGNHGNSDMWVVKINASGIMEWQKCLGGIGVDEAASVIETSDGNFVVVGNTQSSNGDVSGNHGGTDAWVVKLNSAGTLLWQTCLGGSKTDEANDIVETATGNYLIVGSTTSNNGDVSGNHKINFYDLRVVELNSAGTIQWQKCYGGNLGEQGQSVSILSDGNYIIAGSAGANLGTTPPVYNNGDISGHNGNDDVWVIKISPAGTLLWQNCLGGLAEDYGTDITELTDGSLTVVGYTNSNNGDVSGNHHAAFAGQFDGWIANLNSSGVLQWQRCFGNSVNTNIIRSVLAKDDGAFDICTELLEDEMECSIGNEDFFVVRFGCQPFYYADADGDGYGNAAVSSSVCPPLAGYVVNNTDCNDALASANPGAAELCSNSIDDNCNSTIDENLLNPIITATPNDTICLHNGLLSAPDNDNYTYQWYKNGVAIPGAISRTRTPAVTGTYKVLITDLITGCTAFSNGIFMVVNPLPVISLTYPNGTDLCATDTVIISTVFEPGHTYQWYKKGVLQAETTNVFKTTKKGSYTVTVTNTFGCVKYSNAIKVFKFCRLAPETISSADISLYPNPATDKIYIAVETDDLINAEAQIMITNLVGENMITATASFSAGLLNEEIDVISFPQGLYTVQIEYDGEKIVKQFIVQK